MTVAFAPITDGTGSGKRLVPGEYIWTLKAITDEGASRFDSSKSRLKFTFNVDEVIQVDEFPDDVAEDEEAEFEDGLVGNEHWEWVNNTMGANSTLRSWLQGMLGRTITKDDSLSPEQFVGKAYKVQFGWSSYNIQQSGESGTKLTILTIKPNKAKRERPAKEPF